MKLAIHKSVAALIAIMASNMPAAAQLRVEKRATAPVILGHGRAAIVVGFRRPDKKSSNKAGSAAFSRYDPIRREASFQPKKVKKNGDKNTCWVMVKSQDKTLARESAVMVVSAGDDVLFSAMPGRIPRSNTFCLGAPSMWMPEKPAILATSRPVPTASLSMASVRRRWLIRLMSKNHATSSPKANAHWPVR